MLDIFFAAQLLAADMAPAAAKHRHSMADMAFMIGTWHCEAHPTGRKSVSYETSFRWKYPNRSVLDQSIAVPRGSANFMTAYSPATDSFHGVFVGSDGSMGFWDAPGPAATWTEYGYDVANRANPNTRAIFYDVTPVHYAYRFYTISTKDDPGKLIDRESCDKESR